VVAARDLEVAPEAVRLEVDARTELEARLVGVDALLVKGAGRAGGR
jgi:hypothetical protein